MTEPKPLDARRLAINGPARLPLALWRAAAGKRGVLVTAILLIGTAEASKLAIPYLIAQAVDTVQTQGMAGLRHAGILMISILGVATLGWMLHGPGRICERTASSDPSLMRSCTRRTPCGARREIQAALSTIG